MLACDMYFPWGGGPNALSMRPKNGESSIKNSVFQMVNVEEIKQPGFFCEILNVLWRHKEEAYYA